MTTEFEMKLMICNDCGQLIAPQKIGHWEWCVCGNIGGMYLDNVRFQVAIREKKSARVLGMMNGVLHGLIEKGDVWIQHPGDPNSGANVDELDWNQARELYAYSATGGSDTLVLDMARTVGIIGRNDGDYPCFSEMLFSLIFKADRENRNRLRVIFPVHVDMVDRFQLRDGVIAHPQHPEIGMFIPTSGGNFQWITGDEVREQQQRSRVQIRMRK